MLELIEIEGHKCVIVAKKVRPARHTLDWVKKEYNVDFVIPVRYRNTPLFASDTLLLCDIISEAIFIDISPTPSLEVTKTETTSSINIEETK